MNQDDFSVLAKLGTGSYGEVLKVRRISDNQEYAMKKVPYSTCRSRSWT